MKEIDVAKIRELLERALSKMPAISGGHPYIIEIKEAISLLPKPCSECGGSGEVKPFPIDVPKLAMTCPACQAKKRGSCRPEQQLNKPPGVIEKFVKEAKQGMHDGAKNWEGGKLIEALAHLEALLKQIKGLEKTNNEFADGIETVNAACVKKTRLLQAQIKQLEGEKKRLKEALITLGETLRLEGEIHRPEPLVKPTWVCFKEVCHTQMEILIAQALKGEADGG